MRNINNIKINANMLIATVTKAGMLLLQKETKIDRIEIGTSTNEPSPKDTKLSNAVADFSVVSSYFDNKLFLSSAFEYGVQLGVHEIGLYCGDELVATINKELNRADNEAILLMKYRRVYLADISLDLATLSTGFMAVDVGFEEREDLTYLLAMTLQNIKMGVNFGDVASMVAPNRIGQVLTSKLVDGKLEPVWDDLVNVPQTSTPVSDTTPPNPSLFKTLQNMTYDDKTYEFALAEDGNFAELNAGFYEFKFKIPKDAVIFSLKIGNMPVNVPPIGFEGLSVDLFKTPDGYNFTYEENGNPPQYLLENAPFDFNTVFTIYVEYDGKVQISTDNLKYFDGNTLYKMKEGDITSLSVMMPRQ